MGIGLGEDWQGVSQIRYLGIMSRGYGGVMSSMLRGPSAVQRYHLPFLNWCHGMEL